MERKEIKGIIPALLTPFNEEGRVAKENLRSYLRFLKEKVHGLWVCGSYGAGPLMSMSDRRLVAEIACEEVDRMIPVVMHVGCSDTARTIELARHAEQAGSDFVAAVSPYYYNHLDEPVESYYKNLVDAVNIPVIAYNNPKCSHFAIPTEMLVRLADYGLAGVKDSSGDIKVFYDYIGNVENEGFIFLIGSQNLLMPAIVGGGHGCVSGLSNLFPNFLVSIYDACIRGDYETARKKQWLANRLRKLTGPGVPLPFYHVALKDRGIDIGFPKEPFAMPEPQEQERITAALREYLELD
ncbi:MAG: dihydrodipicolinate synthase family protein [bacterium]